MKLRSRILLLAVAVSLVFGVALTGSMLARGFYRNLEAELDRGARTSGMFAASLRASLNAFASLGDTKSARRAIRITAGCMTDLAMVAVLDDSGQLLFDNFPLSLAPLMDQGQMAPNHYLLLRYEGVPYQIIHRKVLSNEGHYSLLYVWPMGEVYDSAAEQTRQAVFFLLLLGGLLAPALFLSLRAVFRPLSRLERAALRIAQGDYAARAPVANPRDEVGQLAQGFNAMAEATQQHVAQLEERDAAQKQFIADMAHELKTPLTSMIGYADLMRRSTLAEEGRQQALGAIVAQGERLERMRDKLLYLARLRGGQQPNMEQVAAGDIFREAALLLEEPLKDKGIDLRTQPGDTRWRCDRDLMIALTQNLLQNAIRASAPGQSILLAATSQSLTVEDQGEGIPPEHLKRVTEAFYMVDKSRSRAQQGAGLGLALCQRIAQLHQARLEIDSQPGQGTRVRVLFTSP